MAGGTEAKKIDGNMHKRNSRERERAGGREDVAREDIQWHKKQKSSTREHSE